MKAKEFWKANKKCYLISTIVVIVLGAFVHLVQSARNEAPINFAEHLAWSIIVSPILVFILMCIIGIVIHKRED